MKFCCTQSEEGNIRITENSSGFKIFFSFLHFFFLFSVLSMGSVWLSVLCSGVAHLCIFSFGECLWSSFVTSMELILLLKQNLNCVGDLCIAGGTLT